MIKDLSKFIEKPLSFQKNFLMNCSVDEKISSFYFRIKIVSKNSIKFYKANNKEIDITDLILNRMWKTPIDDFTSMFLSDTEFMEKNVGITFSFFFFPVSQPLTVAYGSTMNEKGYFRYILDNIKFEDGKIISIGYITEFDRIDTKHLIKKEGINLGCLDIDNPKDLKELLKERNIDKLTKYIKESINQEHLCAETIDDAEGFILRWKNEIYQINQIQSPQNFNSNRLALEIFTHSFVSFINETNYTDILSSHNYVSNVSALFIRYYEWLNQNDNLKLFKYYNITADDLKAPTFGWYAGTYWELVPHKLTREICQKDYFYDNIFKILLNGLKKEKKYNKSALIMTEDDIKTWNDVVKVFSMYNKLYHKFGIKNNNAKKLI